MATTKETVLARISIDDNTKVGFQSYARNAERAKKTTEAFRAHAVDKLVESLDKQVLALGKNARELDLLKAATLSASDAEFASINNLHDKLMLTIKLQKLQFVVAKKLNYKKPQLKELLTQ